ncbi:MAG: MMPL family transporter [Methanococci archaeon]|uniref:Exporter of the RND superfamily protein-like protein n=1 Tax=Methanocaldococcus vulcanius (strain ATCC 700851 / DSM 12094 / M7) TaxID=579137 RepID=C9RGZ2_METVM|nr:MMPL family transporter [Methanocaldococcus vulcanius]ACX72844.1 exporter of the RND superfamily protein-like protein [Methanocaldococcus vulcanius M7]NPA62721.1 MMPL family transporter [Methanococci archaeon]
MLKEILQKIGEFSAKKPLIVILIVIIMSIFAASFIPHIKKQTSYEKMLPQDLKAVKELYEVRDEFGGTDVVEIAVKIVPSDCSDKVVDIRDPRVLNAVKMLEENLRSVDGITRVSSPVDVLIKLNGGTVPQSIDTVKKLMRELPPSEREKMFNKDYSMMVITAFTDVGGDEKKCDNLYKSVNERIKETPWPPGVEAVQTGSIALRALLGDLMNESQEITTSVAFLAIMLIIILHFKRITSVVILTPLVFSLIWTGGFMGLAGIPLDMATSAVGSLVLGLGIDYGIYFGSRYKEEREKGKDPEDAAIITVTYAGSSVLASAATTAAGLLSLTIAPLPMMANLGKVCAAGIIFCCMLTIFFLPAVLVLEDKYVLPLIARIKSKLL